MLEPGNGVSPQQVADVVGALRGAATRRGPPGAADRRLAARRRSSTRSRSAAAAGRRPRDARTPRAPPRWPRPRRCTRSGSGWSWRPDADIGFAGGPWEGVAYADDAATVGADAAAAVSGWKDGEVAPVPGHFPGEGAASGDPALEAATVGLSLAELEARDLKPFAAVAEPRAGDPARRRRPTWRGTA